MVTDGYFEHGGRCLEESMMPLTIQNKRISDEFRRAAETLHKIQIFGAVEHMKKVFCMVGDELAHESPLAIDVLLNRFWHDRFTIAEADAIRISRETIETYVVMGWLGRYGGGAPPQPTNPRTRSDTAYRIRHCTIPTWIGLNTNEILHWAGRDPDYQP